MIGGTAHLDDVVVAVLHHLKSRTDSFTANRKELHEAFFSAKSEFPEVLCVFRFRDKGSFPESLGLDQALANLEASRLLHRQNAAPRFYQIDPALATAYTRFVSKRLEERGVNQEDMKKVAERLFQLTSAVAV